VVRPGGCIAVLAQFAQPVRLFAGLSPDWWMQGIIIVAGCLALSSLHQTHYFRAHLSLNRAHAGLFTLVINAVMLWLTSVVVPQYLTLADLQTTLIASIAISIVSAILNLFVPRTTAPKE